MKSSTTGFKGIRGYTFSEALAVLVVVSIMVSITAPSFISLYANGKIAAYADSVSLFLRLAKQEAQRRQERVAFCAGTPEDRCTSEDWSRGWTLFVTNSLGDELILEAVSTFSTGEFDVTLISGDVFSDGQVIVDGKGLLVHDTEDTGNIVFCHPYSEEYAVVSIDLTSQSLIFTDQSKPASCE